MRLKELRHNIKKSQKYVADEIGINQQSYCRYENELIEPKIEILKKIAKFFKVSVDYLLENTENNKIDICSLSTAQQECIELIKTLDDSQCKVILVLIECLQDKEFKQTEY